MEQGLDVRADEGTRVAGADGRQFTQAQHHPAQRGPGVVTLVGGQGVGRPVEQRLFEVEDRGHAPVDVADGQGGVERGHRAVGVGAQRGPTLRGRRRGRDRAHRRGSAATRAFRQVVKAEHTAAGVHHAVAVAAYRQPAVADDRGRTGREVELDGGVLVDAEDERLVGQFTFQPGQPAFAQVAVPGVVMSRRLALLVAVFTIALTCSNT